MLAENEKKNICAEDTNWLNFESDESNTPICEVIEFVLIETGEKHKYETFLRNWLLFVICSS